MADSLVRNVTDPSGVAWTVRMVQPERVERRLRDRRHGVGATTAVVSDRRAGADRRVTAQLRVRLPAQYAQGWLLLESAAGDRRRVAPVPPNWASLSETALTLLVRMSAFDGLPDD